jgi:hypothetical protein
MTHPCGIMNYQLFFLNSLILIIVTFVIVFIIKRLPNRKQANLDTSANNKCLIKMQFHKTTLFITILVFFGAADAQFICPLDEMALLYIGNNTEVSIKTKYLNSKAYNNVGGIYKFRSANGVIKCKILDLDSSDSGEDYEESLYFHYPEFIKIRNNDFLLSTKKNDSLIVDDKGRVIEVYRKYYYEATYGFGLKYRYLNDTTVLEYARNPRARDSSISIYELDSKFNLKAIKEGDYKKDFFALGVDDIQVFSVITFKYDKIKARINNIEMLNANEKNKMMLASKQTFIYKNNRPIKSFVFDVKKKTIVYEQIYTYRRLVQAIK